MDATTKRIYSAPALESFGPIVDRTGTLGDPFTGDTSFDLDGDVIQTGQNSIDQCPTRDRVVCHRR